jgi:hypothetical protein
MHDTVGETVGKFMQMNGQLMSNQSIQTVMYRLNENRRTQTMLQLDETAAYLRTQGLLSHETTQVITEFARLSAQGPKQRLQESAQLRAVGGALGLHGTNRLSQMLLLGQTSSPEFAKLALGLQKQLHREYAAAIGTPQEFVQYALTNLPGVQAILGQNGPLAASATRRGMAQPKLATDIAAAISKNGPPKPWWGTVETAVLTIEQHLQAFLGKDLIGTLLGGAALWPYAKSILNKLGIGKSTGGAADAADATATDAATGELAIDTGAVGAAAAGGVVAIGSAAAVGVAWALDHYFPHNPLAQMGGDLSRMFSPSGKTPHPGLLQTHNDLLKKYEQNEQKGVRDTTATQQALMKQLDAVTKAIAALVGQNPTHAIDRLHQTIKTQHLEETKLAHEQLDATHEQVVAQRTSRSPPRVVTHKIQSPS